MNNIIISNRKKFIREFFTFMYQFDYALLKYFDEDINLIGEYSDLDIAIKSENKNCIIKFITNNNYSLKTKIFHSSFMEMVYIFFNDGSFLEIDLIHKFKRKELIYMNISDLIKTSESNSQNIKTPDMKFQFMYIFLFYTLNKVSVDKKYINYLQECSAECRKRSVTFINKTYTLKIENLSEIISFNKDFHTKIRRTLRKRNGIFSVFLNSLYHLLDMYRKKNKSMVISIRCPHNKNESKFLGEFKAILEKKYRNIVIIMEHRKTNFTSKIMNTLKIFFKYYLNGYIIIYDSNISDYFLNPDISFSIPPLDISQLTEESNNGEGKKIAEISKKCIALDNLVNNYIKNV